MAPHRCPHPRPWEPVTVLGYRTEGDGEIVLDYLGGPTVLMERRQHGQSSREGAVMREAEVRDVLWLGGTTGSGTWVASSCWRSQGMNSPLEPPQERSPTDTLILALKTRFF